MKCILVFLILLECFLLGVVDASELNDAFSLALKQNLNKTERLIIANALNNQCVYLLKSVSELSPRKDEWLNNEISSGREKNLMQKPEYSIDSLRRAFSNCTVGAKIIIQSESYQIEALGWTVMLVTLIDQDLSYYMKNSGVHFTEQQINGIPVTLVR